MTKVIKNNNGMVQKRTEMQKNRDEIILVNLYFKNIPFRKMGDALQERSQSDYKISMTEIKKMLDKVMAFWKEKNIITIDERQNRELAKLDSIELEYWEGWQRSLRPGGKTSTKETPEGIVTTRTHYERDGSPRWLEGVERTIMKRCQLLGLLNPLIMGSNSDGYADQSELPLNEIQQRLISVLNIQQNNLIINNKNDDN